MTQAARSFIEQLADNDIAVIKIERGQPIESIDPDDEDFELMVVDCVDCGDDHRNGECKGRYPEEAEYEDSCAICHSDRCSC